MWCHEPNRMPYASYCFFYFILSYLKVEETDLTLAFMSSGHQKKTLSKPAGDGAITLEEFEKLVSSPKLRCQKTTSREEKHRPNKRGNFEVGVLIHIFLQSWVLLSYRLILFGWQSKLFFSLNYDYGEEGYGIDMFQIAQVQCLPWQSFKGSERIRLFKSWLRSHPHTHTHTKKSVCICYLRWFWCIFAVNLRSEIRWFLQRIRKGFPKSWWWYRDIVFSHGNLALQISCLCYMRNSIESDHHERKESTPHHQSNSSKGAHNVEISPSLINLLFLIACIFAV